MFKLELDLRLKFIPPMHEHSSGIIVTRTIDLPYAPSSGLRIFGSELDECPDPMGFTIEDVTWDLDREVFLAHTSIVCVDEPMAFIPGDLRSWIDRGWRLGSFEDNYGDNDDTEEDSVDNDEVNVDADEEYARLEIMHTLPRNRRNREFNQFFKAMVRHMAENFDNSAVAYAMDKLGRFVPKTTPGPDEPPLPRKWREARAEFLNLSLDEQLAWQVKTERYPSIEDAIAG